MSRADVAVVGAGPVGLSLALGLARAGASITVLEKEPGTADRSRAPAIWPRTQEILEELGVLGRFLGRGIALEEVELWDTDRERPLLRLPFRELAGETDHPRLLVVPQSVTERLLLEAVEARSSAEVRFSTEVTGVAPDPSGAGVLLRHRGGAGEGSLGARFAVGCDGAHSSVREAVGARFDGITYGTRAALADVELEADRPWRFPRLTTRERLAVAIRIEPLEDDGRGTWRLILPFPPADELPLDERVRRAVEHLFGTDRFTTTWKSEFRLHRRVASRFASGRVVLAGDAAHLNSPVGGQGMNSGIQDAEQLVPALMEALQRDDPGPIEVYAHRRRREVDAGVNRFTDRLTRLLLFRQGRFVRPALRLTSLVLRLAPLRHALLRRLAMLDRAR